MSKLKYRIAKLTSVIGLFVLIVSAVVHLNTVIKWLHSASLILYRELGFVGTHSLLFVSLLAFWLNSFTPRWMYKVTPERYKKLISWLLFSIMTLTLVVFILSFVGGIIDDQSSM